MKKRILSWLIMCFVTGTTVFASVMPLEKSVIEEDKPRHTIGSTMYKSMMEDNYQLPESRKAVEVVKLTTETPAPTPEPTVEVTQVPVKKQEVKMVTATPAPTPVATPQSVQMQTNTSITEEDIRLIALLTMAEAEGECELGKRLVIDTVLNRVDSSKFPNTVYGVVYQSGQFTSMFNGRAARCYVDEYICQLVREEIASRTNYEVLYFRAGHYFGFGTPVVNVGNHYFSTY